MEAIKNPFQCSGFSKVAFTCRAGEPSDQEIRDMVDEVIAQLYGKDGLRKIIKQGDHVVIKVNIVMANCGAHGDKGRAIITDPRITRYVAELVRDIIGWDNGADLKVIDACFYPEPDPSLVSEKTSFHWARLNRVPYDTVDAEDITYDYNADGYLDGTSKAKLVNLDAIGEDGRVLHTVQLEDGTVVRAALPKFLQTRKEARGGDDFTDVFIGLPVLKNHWFVGISGSLKLHYGLRALPSYLGDTGRRGHEGFYLSWKDGKMHANNLRCLQNYLTAIHKVRGYDLVIMDCLTANRNGPGSPSGSVSCGRDPDEAVDYILSNAIMASEDSCAIDTVETAFAGYKPTSVDLPQVAASNGIGIADPAHIFVLAEERFKFQKQRLAQQYSPDGRYPLSDSGGTDPVPNVIPNFAVELVDNGRRPASDGKHHLKYRVVSLGDEPPNICRVDLHIQGTVVESRIGSDISSGEFSFYFDEYDWMNHAYIVGRICAWDSDFNCVPTYTEFFIPPDDVEAPL